MKNLLLLLVVGVCVRALPVGPPSHSYANSSRQGRPQVPALPPTTPQQFEQALGELGNDSFDVRRDAEARLHRWTAGQALTFGQVTALQKLVRTTTDPEVRARARRVVAHAQQVYSVPQATIKAIAAQLGKFSEADSNKGWEQFVALNKRDRERVITFVLNGLVNNREGSRWAADRIFQNAKKAKVDTGAGPYDDALEFMRERANELVINHPTNFDLAMISGRKDLLQGMIRPIE